MKTKTSKITIKKSATPARKSLTRIEKFKKDIAKTVDHGALLRVLQQLQAVRFKQSENQHQVRAMMKFIEEKLDKSLATSGAK